MRATVYAIQVVLALTPTMVAGTPAASTQARKGRPMSFQQYLQGFYSLYFKKRQVNAISELSQKPGSTQNTGCRLKPTLESVS
jgi:hypothetical protein